MRYIHLAERWLNQPLLLSEEKLAVLIAVLAPRLGLQFDSDLELRAPLVLDLGGDADSRQSYSVNPSNGIALMPIRGSMVKHGDSMNAMSGMTSYEQIQATLREISDNPSIKGVLLAIDSPGGEVAGNFETAAQISALAQAKPVWAAADSFAYSAAYSLAAPAKKIYVPEVGGVGSIGVLAVHVDRSEYYKSAGITHTIVKSGARKADGNPYEPLSGEARKGLQDRMDKVRAVFVDHVARHRKLDPSAVHGTEGEVYLGRDAVDLGLADRLGSVADAYRGLEKSLQTTRVAVSMPTQLAGQPENTRMANEPADQTAQPEVACIQDTVVQGLSINVVDIDAARAAARAETLAYVTEIQQLCRLAGDSGLAEGFIQAQTPAAEVRKKLLDARATASETPAVSGLHSAGTKTAAKDGGRGSRLPNAVKAYAKFNAPYFKAIGVDPITQGV